VNTRLWRERWFFARAKLQSQGMPGARKVAPDESRRPYLSGKCRGKAFHQIIDLAAFCGNLVILKTVGVIFNITRASTKAQMELPLQTLAPAAAFAKSVLDEFKPSKAPYLLAVSMGALFIGLALGSDMDQGRKMLIILPIYVFILVLSVLAFYFKPFEDNDLLAMQESIESNFDSQIKLARTTGLIVGISCLYILASRRETYDAVYMFIWGIVLLHCLTYLVYIMFRNIKEESPSNKSYFQLSFMTSLFLFLLTFSGSKMQMADTSYFYDKCTMEVSFNAIEKNSSDSTKPEQTPPDRTETVECDTESEITNFLQKTYADIIIRAPGRQRRCNAPVRGGPQGKAETGKDKRAALARTMVLSRGPNYNQGICLAPGRLPHEPRSRFF
jgi:hypothetical protein